MTARASLFTDHKISGLPVRAKHSHVRTMCEQTVDNLQLIHFLLLWIDDHPCMRRDFVKFLSRFIRKFAISFYASLCMTFHVIRPWRYCFGIRFPRFFWFWQLFCSPGKNPWFEHTSVIIHDILLIWHSLWVQPNKHGRGKMLVLPNRLLWVVSTSDQCFVSFQPILCHPHTQMRIILFDGVRISIPN